jgi:acetolactate decarboxylase
MKNIKTILFIFTIFIFSTFIFSQQKSTQVNIIGAMKNVMWKGQLQANIDLDTIYNKENLYGLGPVEYLKGEIIIVDGKAYKSTVLNDTLIQIEETFEIKAPFFGYATISNWKEILVPDKVQNTQQLEKFINKLTKKSNRPFIFKMTCTVDSATIHIMNLPDGTIVKSPEDAHLTQVNYLVQNDEVIIVGFFSTEHKTIFTHHDTFLHMHLMTKDLQKMGHLDDVKFKKGTLKLYLPVY